MKGNTMKVLIGLFALVAVLGIAWMATGGGKGITLSLGDLGPSVSTTSGSCAEKGVPSTIYAAAYWADPTRNYLRTQVATTAAVAKSGSSLIYNTTTSSATQATITAVPCGEMVSVVFGDGGGTTYYYNGETFQAVGVTESREFELKRSGAVTVFVHNDTATGWASTINLGNESITDPDTTIALQVKVPTTAGAYFGDLGWAFCVLYNANNFTNMYPSPYSAKVSIPHVTASGNQNTIGCYEMPGLLVSAGAPYQGVLYLDKIAGNILNTTTIGARVVDKTSMLFNGNFVQGYDTGVTDGLNTDAGRADVTVATLVTIYAPAP